MIKTIKDADLLNKIVILRVDYNVTLKDGQILSTKRIDSTFKTIDYLISQNCKVIIMSHFGKVKTEEDKKDNSLKPVYEYIKSLNKYDISFTPFVMGSELESAINSLKHKGLLLMENIRFLDLKGELESKSDAQMGMYYSKFADVYIDDAFGVMHRDHTSVTSIPKYMPSYIGFLVEEEITGLDKIINNPIKPFVVVMGGAKLDDKISLIKKLVIKADYILLGGGIANTFLKASGYDIGESLFSNDTLLDAKELLEGYSEKIILPTDVVVNKTYAKDTVRVTTIDDVETDDVIGDIGFQTIEKYKEYINQAHTIFINGSVGVYEEQYFANGTKEILNVMSQLNNCYKVVGGGDALSSVEKFGYNEKFEFLSTGGGATLSYLADGTLIGLEAIKNEKSIL